MKKNNYSSIETIINVAKRGGMYILVDDEKRENEGDLVMSTSDTNARNINFMAKHGRGLICLALDSIQAKRLNLSLMSPVNQSRNQTAFTVSIAATSASLKTSFPDPRSMLSVPAEALTVSSPAPVLMKSLPVPPVTV